MLWLVLSLASLTAGALVPGEADTEMRHARDGNIAIQEELDAARRAGTVEAYDLFIARHPEHPLAAIAREERQRILDKAHDRRS